MNISNHNDDGYLVAFMAMIFSLILSFFGGLIATVYFSQYISVLSIILGAVVMFSSMLVIRFIFGPGFSKSDGVYSESNDRYYE